MASQCIMDMDDLKEDQAVEWVLVEARHLVLVLVCLEGWLSVA